MERCYWTYKDCLDTDVKGTAIKWSLQSDCGKEVIMTPTNKYGKLRSMAIKPYPQGVESGVYCPFCGKELDFYNPYED